MRVLTYEEGKSHLETEKALLREAYRAGSLNPNEFSRIEAIKWVRDFTAWSLRDAHDWVFTHFGGNGPISEMALRATKCPCCGRKL